MGKLKESDRPSPEHEVVEALLAADPHCEKDESPDNDETTLTFVAMPRRAEAERRP